MTSSRYAQQLESGRARNNSPTILSLCDGLIHSMAGLIVTALVARGSTVANAPLVLAIPLAVAGAGCGLVISANQTLTLHEITRATAGVAAGVYETGQRIGTALGTAVASAAGLVHTPRMLPLVQPRPAVLPLALSQPPAYQAQDTSSADSRSPMVG